jgi:DNA-binding beta-propeller fold protein YncE
MWRTPGREAPVAASSRALIVLGLIAGCASTGKGLTADVAPTSPPAARAIDLSGGAGGIGFDDVRFAPDLGRVLVPAGHTGRLDLVDPTGFGVTSIGGFSTLPTFPGGHDTGTTSADAGGGVIVAIDRTARLLDVVDPKAGAIVSSARLGGSPDLVRHVSVTREAWVTEPDDERIEVLALSAGDRPAPAHAAFIAVKGGPESLTVDETRGRAYTHLGKGVTVAIDLKSRAVVAQWPNGCGTSSGAALDAAGGRLFVGCAEGKVVVLDLAGGRQLASFAVGASIDHVAYSPSLHHLYVPDTKSATMATLAVSARGDLTLLGSVATVAGTECVTTDDRGHAYLCDPAHGRILVVTDPHPASG